MIVILELFITLTRLIAAVGVLSWLVNCGIAARRVQRVLVIVVADEKYLVQVLLCLRSVIPDLSQVVSAVASDVSLSFPYKATLELDIVLIDLLIRVVLLKQALRQPMPQVFVCTVQACNLRSRRLFKRRTSAFRALLKG